MKKLKQEKIIVIALFILIIFIQILIVTYATSKREYYHIDEYYSHGLMGYKRAFIYENEDFLDNWHDKEYYRDYLVINEQEKNDFSSVYNNQVEDVHPPLYYLLLRIMCNFNINEFSIWPGTILNIIIFIIASIFLFLIAKEVFKNSYYALLICFISGFSLAIIETVMYVRMYELLVLNILMLIYWHMQKSEIKKFTYKDVIPLYIMVILGFLTHYYYLIIVAILFIMYMIRYIKQKEYKNMAIYITTLIASGITGILIFPYSIFHIFFSYRGQEVTTNLFDFSILLSNIKENITLINREIFNGYGSMVIVFATILCTLWLMLKKEKTKTQHNNHIKYISIPMVIYLVISIMCSPYIDLRYLMPVIPLVFCSLIYMFYDILKDIVSKRNTFLVLIIISVCFAVTVIPKLSNNTYTYKGQGKVLKYLENEINNKPMVYIYQSFSAQYNKTMECYEALTKMDKTYIMSQEKFSVDNLKSVVKDLNVDNGIVMMMHFIYKEEILEEILNEHMYNEVKVIGKLGRFVIIELK